MGFLTDTETAVTSGFSDVANHFGEGLLDTFRPAFITGFAIWITLISYEVAFGKSEDSFTYIFTKIGKIFLIGTIALWGWQDLSDLLMAVKDGFVQSGTISGVLETNLINPITALWDRLYQWFGSAVSENFSFTDLGRLISILALFLLLFICYALMSAVAAVYACIALAMYLIANSVFILLLAIGPFFLLCLAFPFLQRFFETFIGTVMTAILGMAFTVLMVMFVANFFGLVGMQNIVPLSSDQVTVTQQIKSMVVTFLGKAGSALLIIYLTYKVFDLAAALGGGLNMGNNLVGGVRAIFQDLKRNYESRGGNGSGNAMSQGSAAPSGASQRAGQANSTFTGMAMSAAGPAISTAAQGAGTVARTAASGAASVGRIAGYGAGRVASAATSIGRYAYNRYSSATNRNSAS